MPLFGGALKNFSRIAERTRWSRAIFPDREKNGEVRWTHGRPWPTHAVFTDLRDGCEQHTLRCQKGETRIDLAALAALAGAGEEGASDE